MFERDYFMRLISQMTEAAGTIMGLRRQRKMEEALLFIDDELDTKFRLNGKLIRQLSDADLVRMMTRSGVVETSNLHAIALLLKEEADIYDDLNRPERSYPVRLKALHLFLRLAIMDAPAMLRTPSEEAAELLAKLGEYELPAATKQLVLEWNELEGRYAKAEDVLWELLEDKALPVSEADEFYGRLLLFPDDKLEGGGLPRDEVAEGRRRLAAFGQIGTEPGV